MNSIDKKDLQSVATFFGTGAGLAFICAGLFNIALKTDPKSFETIGIEKTVHETQTKSVDSSATLRLVQPQMRHRQRG